MGLKEWKTEIVAVVIAILIVFAVMHQYWMPYLIPEVTEPAAYQTGLSAFIKVYDDTSHAMLTSNISPEVYPLDTDPYVKLFTTKPDVTAAYTTGARLIGWMFVADAGSYTMLIKDTAGTKTKYPAKVDVTVPGTDNDDMETNCQPSMEHMVQRCSFTLSKSILAYNDTSEAYDITASTINYTAYDKWQISFTISLAGEDKGCYAGRLYTSEYTNLAPTDAYVDGISIGAALDKDAADDSMTGYYTDYTEDWEGGEVHHYIINFEEVATLSAGTLTMTLCDFYEVQNTKLKWWTYETTTVTVEA